MSVKIEKAAGTGFCFGVKRAITILEKTAKERGKVETLGAVVHNKQVLQRLKTLGVKVADSVEKVRGNTLAIGAHGVGPEVEAEINARNLNIIDTTCSGYCRTALKSRFLCCGLWRRQPSRG